MAIKNCFNCKNLEIPEITYINKTIFYRCDNSKLIKKEFPSKDDICNNFKEELNTNPITNPTLHLPELRKICKYWGVNSKMLSDNQSKAYSNARVFFVVFLFQKYYKRKVSTQSEMTRIVNYYFKKSRVSITSYLLLADNDYVMRDFRLREAYNEIFN